MTSALSGAHPPLGGNYDTSNDVGLSNGASAGPLFDGGATTEMAEVSPPSDSVGMPGGMGTFAAGVGGAALHSRAMKGDNAYARSVDRFSERAANKIGKTTTPDPEKFDQLRSRAKEGDSTARRTLDRYERSNKPRYNRLNRLTNNASGLTKANKTVPSSAKGRAGALAGRAGRLGATALRLAPMAFAAAGPWGLLAGAVVLGGIAMFSSESFRTWVTGGIRPSGIGANDPPSPPTTHFLPLPEDSRDETVVPVDTRLTSHNDTITDIDPQAHRLWDQENPGVTSLTRMTSVSDRINEISGGIDRINEQFSSIYSGGQSASNVVADSAHAMKPYIDHLADFGTQAGKPLIRATLDAAETGDATFQAIRDANSQSRQAISQSQGQWLGVMGGGHIKGTDLTDNTDIIEQRLAQLREHTMTLKASTQEWAEAQPNPRSLSVANPGRPDESGPNDPPNSPPAVTPRVPVTPSGTGPIDPGGSDGSDGDDDTESGIGDPIKPEDEGPSPDLDDPAGSGAFGEGGSPLDPAAGGGLDGSGLDGGFGDPLGAGPGDLGADIGSEPLDDPFGTDDLADPATSTSSEADPWGAGDLDDIWAEDEGLETESESSDGFGSGEGTGVADDAAGDPFGDANAGESHAGGEPLEDGGPAGGASEGPGGGAPESPFGTGDDPAGEPGGDGPTTADELGGDPWGQGDSGSGETNPALMVDVGNEEREFLNEPVSGMASDIFDESVQTPESFSELAANHGLELPAEGNDIGAAISPAEMQPGDVLVSEGQTYMYVGGEEAVDPATGEVHDVADVANFSGEHEGVFRLDTGDGEVTYSGGTDQANEAASIPSDEPSHLTSDSGAEGGASTSGDQGRDGQDFSRTDTAPIGMGDGQNVPGGDQDQPETDPESGGISEVPYQGEPLGGSDDPAAPETGQGNEQSTAQALGQDDDQTSEQDDSADETLGPVEAEHDPDQEFGGATSSTAAQSTEQSASSPDGLRDDTGALDPSAIN